MAKDEIRRPLILLALVLYVFTFQGSRGLWDPDEGRYTAVALEMGRLGDYVLPRLHHEVEHLTKPPLTCWLLAGSLAVFGASEWAVRLPNGLAFLATILLIARLGRRLAPTSPWFAPLRSDPAFIIHSFPACHPADRGGFNVQDVPQRGCAPASCSRAAGDHSSVDFSRQHSRGAGPGF